MSTAARAVAPPVTASLWNPEHRRISLALSLVSRRHEALTRAMRILVVGCGRGDECYGIAHVLGSAEVTGVDLRRDFVAREEPRVELLTADAVHLPFPSARFDFVYSFHALEHVAGGAEAPVAEIARVLKPDGAFFCGVPNRRRLVGYIDSGASWSERIAWNAKDWKARMLGRFRNEDGAHAGFTDSEFRDLLARHFLHVDSERCAYFAGKYERAAGLVRGLSRTGLAEFVFPCNYYTCRGVRSD